jgi:hypothetical protein
MKLRKLAIVVTMVLLAIAMVVVPVQAGKPGAGMPFTFKIVNVSYPGWEESTTGKVLHYCVTVNATVLVLSGDTRLDGGRLTWIVKGLIAYSNPQGGESGWGPVNGTWRIDTSALGEPASGWEGTFHLGPWQDPLKWPNVMVPVFTGSGFGIYKNTHIRFSGYSPFPFEGREFAGEFSE